MTVSKRSLESYAVDAISSGGTIAFQYPSGLTGFDFVAEGATLAIGGNVYPAGGLFTLVLGDNAATVTLAGGLSIPALSTVRLGLSELTTPLDAGLAIGNVRPRLSTKTASFTLGADEKGRFVHANSASAIVVTLPNSWRTNDHCVVRRVGAGAVTWAAASGSTIVLPTSKAAHVGISEQHGEMVLRVTQNTDGVTAQWAISGATA